ncbi:hypothetical protein V500_03774 [Pseudogymnoascus sp. VKM F-4518 (FW-2643)]|nr:hypothetical protein V500_03774 [Pseudogymnoascus sp. VKM F-4518 (FW-2643)]
MDTIQRSFEHLGQRSQTQPTAPEPWPFLDLPLELIFLIASCLPIESVGSLSLSCHYLYSRLKTEYLQPLKEADYVVMNAFLHLLERDLPLHIVCPYCNKLHFTPFAERHLASERYCPIARKTWSTCRATDSWAQNSGNMAPRFTSTIFFMAMKAHRQGKDTSALLRLLSHKTIDSLPGFAQLHTAEARIRNGSLLVRDQKVFMVPASHTTPFSLSGEFGFCRHTMLESMWDLQWCGIHVPKVDEIHEHENKEGIIYCQYCHTELRIDFKSYGKAGNAVFVTRWMDIGEGRDRNDVKWKTRWSFEWLWDDAVYPRGSISAAFEETDDFRFDSLLTEQDEMELCAKCPLLGPESENGRDDEGEPSHMVKDGRLVILSGKGGGRYCSHIRDR